MKKLILQKVTTAKNVLFVIIGFLFMDSNFKDSVCNGCHDFTVLSVSISDIAFIAVKNVNYRFIIHSISKSEAINLLKNFVLEDSGYI